MILREARIEDCEIVARGICIALHREPDGEMQKCIARICEREDVLYSYKHTIIAWENDTPVGICLCYDGAKYHEMRKTTFPLFDELMHDDKDHEEMDLDNMQDEAEAGVRQSFYGCEFPKSKGKVCKEIRNYECTKDLLLSSAY